MSGIAFGGGPKTGAKNFLYQNTGSVEIPVWVEVNEIGDVSLTDLVRNLAELKRRGSEFIKGLPSLFQMFGLEFNMIHGLDKAVHDRVRRDFFQARIREYLVLDSAISNDGAQGMRMPVIVQNFPWGQALEDVSSHDVRLTVAYLADGDGEEVDPTWYVVGGDDTSS